MNHSQTPNSTSTKTFSFARLFTPKGTKSFTFPDQPKQAGSPFKKSGLDAYAKKNKQTLPPDFSDQVLEYEMELEKPDISLDVVNKLTELYTEAMAHYEAEGSHKYKYFSTKLQNLMMKSSVKEAMLKGMDGNKSDDQEKVIRRMRFDNKVNSISTDVEAFTLVKKQENTEKELNKVLEGDLSTQKDRFRQKLAERKNRTISRAQSVTTLSDENSSATDEATRDAEFDSPLKQDPQKKLNEIEEVDESRYATPPRKRNKEGHIVFYHKEKKGNKLVEIEDDVKKPHKSNRRHSMHREPVVSVVKVQNRMSRAQSFGNNKLLPVIDRLKPIAPQLLSPTVEIKSADPTEKKDLKDLMSRAKSQGLLLASANQKNITGITEENESDSSSSDSSAASNQDINAQTTNIQEKLQASSINEVAPETTNEGEKSENKTAEANEERETFAEKHSAQPVEADRELQVDQIKSVEISQRSEVKESNQVAEDTQNIKNVEHVRVIEANEESAPATEVQRAEQTTKCPSTDAQLNETAQQPESIETAIEAVEIKETLVSIEAHNIEDVKSIEAIAESLNCDAHTTEEHVETAEVIQSAVSDPVEVEELKNKDQTVEITNSEQSTEIVQVESAEGVNKVDECSEVIQTTTTNEEAIPCELNAVEIDKTSEEHQAPVVEVSTEVEESNHVHSSNEATESIKTEEASIPVEPYTQESSGTIQITELVTAVEAKQVTQEEAEENPKVDEVQASGALEVSETNQDTASAENFEVESVLAVKLTDPVEPVRHSESVDFVEASKDLEPQNLEESKEVKAPEVIKEDEKVTRKRTDSEAVNEKRQAAMKQIDQENQVLLEEFVSKQAKMKEEVVKTIELKFEKKLKSMEDDMDDDEKVGAMWQKVLAKMSKDKETEMKTGMEKLEQEQLIELEKYKKKQQQQKMFKLAQLCSDE